MLLSKLASFFPLLARDEETSMRVLDENNNYCAPSVILTETNGCQIGTVETFNSELAPFLEQLLETPFFRYFKVNLSRKCVLWSEAPACTSEGCAISTLPGDPVNWEAWLSDVRYPSMQASKTLFRAWDYDDDEFCLLDSNGANGSYIDLIENPERFTGYVGPNAGRVWAAMYDENCFSPEDQGANPLFNSTWAQCTERRIFYRVVSGLHSSISVHLAYEWFNTETAQWERNLSVFDERVGRYMDRLRNMYLIYMLLCSAVSKITSRLDKMTFLPDDSVGDARIHKLLGRIANSLPQLPAEFDQVVFSSSATPQIIAEFKERFKRLMKIMDCVSCERCRLWGKIQITGVGTALKIIFNHENPDRWRDMVLRRSEIIALYNTFGRLSESVVAVEEFREMYAKHSVAEEHDASSNMEHIASEFIVDCVKFLDAHRSPLALAVLVTLAATALFVTNRRQTLRPRRFSSKQ